MNINSLLPQPPWAGPPLPRALGKKWPWHKDLKGNIQAVCDPETGICNPNSVWVENHEIIRLHNQGVPAIEIAARLDVASELVRYRLRRAGLEPIRAPKFLKAEERRHDIIWLHQEGLPAKEIAKRLGVDWGHVCLRLRQAKLEPHPSREEARAAETESERIISFAREGVPRYEIAKRTGTTWALVSDIMAKASVRPATLASAELASWAASLIPLVDDIRQTRPDTEPVVKKVDKLEEELTAMTGAAHVEEGKLPRRGIEADRERWRLGFSTREAYSALELMDALRGCLKLLDTAKLPRLLEQAETCISNISRNMDISVSRIAMSEGSLVTR